MSLYVIGPMIGGGPFKVGYSNSPERRLEEGQTWNADELAIYATGDGDLDIESQVHYALRTQHLRGEWFRGSFDDLLLKTEALVNWTLTKWGAEEIRELEALQKKAA